MSDIKNGDHVRLRNIDIIARKRYGISESDFAILRMIQICNSTLVIIDSDDNVLNTMLAYSFGFDRQFSIAKEFMVKIEPSAKT